MIGLPSSYQTKQDYTNAVDYAIRQKEGIGAMISRLENLRDNTKILVLKESSKSKPAEEQTPDDYERVENPACEKIKLGFTDAEINQLIRRLQNAR